MNRCVLLDRDGVINRAVRDGYVLETSAVEILPGAARAIADLNAAGYSVLVVTNQQCVGKGMLAPEILQEIHDHIREKVALESGGRIEAFYCCPHLAQDACLCRKPKPGLIHQARDQYGFEIVQTYFVGDSYSDLITAGNAGCKPIFVLSGLDAERYRAGVPLPHLDCPVAPDLAEAVRLILENTLE